jgi:uncharacterized repeat protein (TIGR01451 family)
MKKLICITLLLLTNAISAQVANPVPDVILCDDPSNNGVETFDLSIFDTYILDNQLSTNFVITYYLSQADADLALSPLPTNYTTNSQIIFARIEDVSNAGNFDTTSFGLFVLEVPVLNAAPTSFTFCGITTTSGLQADLSQIEPVISTGQLSISFSYYLTQADADIGINPLPNNQLEAPSNTPTTIFIRAENSMNPFCFETLSVDANLSQCDGFRIRSILDVNLNGVVDATDIPFPQGTFNWEKNSSGNVIQVATLDSEFILYESDPTSFYDLGYTITPDFVANYSVTPATYTAQNVPVSSGVTTKDFLVTPVASYEDVVVYIIPQEQPRPGFTYKEKVVYANLGSATVTTGQLQFTYDPQLSVVAVNDPAAVVGATTVDLNYTNLLPFEYRTMEVEMQIPVIPTINLGDVLMNTSTITPLTNDITPNNNTSVSSQIVIGSYDPNDKMESRGNFINPSEFGSDNYLYYTIRFENTGTASAINVRIEDTLDAQLDWNSIEMIDSSHNYVMERMEEQLEWRFDNILLLDSTTDPVGANGYVYFKIKPLVITEGTIIPNTAEIYFDFNPPIITNTFTSTFQTPLSNHSLQNVTFNLIPNPTSGIIEVNLINRSLEDSQIILYDLTGRITLSQKLTKENNEVNLSELPKGIYIAELRSGNELYTSKIVKD